MDKGDKLGGAFGVIKGAVGEVVGAFKNGESSAGNLVTQITEHIGRLRDFAVDVWRRVSAVFEGTGDDFRALGEGFANVAGFLIATIEPIVKRILPGLALAIEGIAKVIRGVVKVVGGVLTGDWSRAWDGAKDIVMGALEAIAGAVKATFGGLWGLVRRAFDNIAGGASSLLGVMAEVVEAGAKIPGIGGKFKGLAEEIRGARTSIDKYRESLRDADKAQDKQSSGLDKARDRTRKARDAFEDARKELGRFKEGTDGYREAAEKAQRKADNLADAIKDQRKATRDAIKPTVTMIGSVFGLGETVANVADAVGGNLNEVLKEVGAKAIRYTIRKPKKAAGDLGAFAGFLAGSFQGGGFLGARGLRGDDTELVAAAPGEAFLTHHQQTPVDAALAFANALGMPVPGSLDQLFATDKRPHRFQTGGRLDLRGAGRHMAPFAMLAGAMGLGVTSGLRPGDDGHHGTGNALDVAAPMTGAGTAAMLRFGRAAAAKWPGLEELIHTPMGFGIKSGRRVPPYATADHYDHVHGASLGPMSAMAMEVARLIIDGPAGSMKRIAQGGADVLVKGANAKLDRMAPRYLPGGAKDSGGQYSPRGLAALWQRVNGRLGDARTMGAIGYAESTGNPAAHGPPDGRGLWQIEWPVWGVDARPVRQPVQRRVKRPHGRRGPPQAGPRRVGRLQLRRLPPVPTARRPRHAAVQ